MKVVVDTNVIISGLMTRSGYANQIIDACRREQVQLVLARPQVVEIDRVLHYPKIQTYLHWDESTLRSYLHDLQTFAEVVPARLSIRVTADPTDNMLFAAALEAGAHYVVSGDQAHVLAVGRYRGVQTVSPRVFVETILAPV